ncbi:hypothetical protein BJ508DRAFT_364496 [Ascobolus immersus RN42]|uniref:Uncharacterized protein n=1 Tax=Ascobolus immersus RN42 TaxID=1160509 RepID=A0A3N4HZP2_ASCIM|nr:hypothetical protein BJ508DRAFT_364496 [Ascobolus immersus RN42]
METSTWPWTPRICCAPVRRGEPAGFHLCECSHCESIGVVPGGQSRGDSDSSSNDDDDTGYYDSNSDPEAKMKHISRRSFVKKFKTKTDYLPSSYYLKNGGDVYVFPDMSGKLPKLEESLRRNDLCFESGDGSRQWLLSEIEYLPRELTAVCRVAGEVPSFLPMIECYYCFCVDTLYPYLTAIGCGNFFDRIKIWLFLHEEILEHAEKRAAHGLLRDEEVQITEAFVRSTVSELQVLVDSEEGYEEIVDVLNDLITQAKFLRRMRSERLELLILRYLAEDDVNMEVSDGVLAATANTRKRELVWT